MYRASGLIVEPSTEYRVIFSTDRQLDVTMHGHTEDVHRPPDTTSGFTSLDFETVTTVARQLPTYQDIVDAALTTTPLVGRIDMTSVSGALSAEILFPIRTINYHTSPMRFQVDTGPLIVPDLDAQIDHPVDRCRLAHVIFNTFDYAEFVCRRDEPTEPAGDSGTLFHHYSQVESHSVNTRLFATDS